MPTLPTKIETIERLSRNLGLMQAGSTVTIDISTPAGQKVKFRTTFIGYLPKKYVLVQIPDSNRLGNFSRFIVQGTAVTVRGIIEGHEGAVAAFISTIKQTLQLPSRIMVLDFPQTVSIQSLRAAVRIDTEIPAKVKIEQEYWQAQITNISISGCQIIIQNGDSLTIARDDSLHMLVEDFQEKENLMLDSVVRSVKSINENLSLGVKFQPEIRENVIKLINHIIINEGV
ncbi:PilZ domain-containing protein [Thalassotalea piscium]|nr:PilZ domain-containing protein [Thalassotalea piscium]